MRRLATRDDVQEIFSICMHDKVSPFLVFDPMPLESFRTVCDDMLKGGDFFVHEVSGEVSGQAVGRVGGFYKAWRLPGRAHHVARLESLAVHPRLQGNGIARTMVLDAVDHLRAAGVRRVDLLVESDNSRALHLFTKLGFEIEGTLRDSYKRASEAQYVDAYLMALMLP
jgi:ribosomal protein S18 acetylase RimI-like enzyme